MEIRIQPNVAVPEIPLAVDVMEGACLRDVLLRAAPQVIDKETGAYIDDADFWDIRLNEVPLYLLKEGLNTRMSSGDVIRMEILFHLS